MNTKALITLISLSCLPATTMADVTWKQNIKPLNKGVFPKLPPTKFQYGLSWKGSIGAGVITFDFNKKDQRYPGYNISQAYGKSTGFAYSVFPYHFSLTSFSQANQFRSSLFVADETDKKAQVDTKNQFKKSSVTHKSTKTYKKKKEPRIRDYNYKVPHTLDPLAAVQYIRSQALTDGQELHLSLHPFDSAMYAKINVLGREVHNGKNSIKINVKLYRVDNETHVLREYKKLVKATLWITDDADRYLTELRCDVKVGIISGDVRMVMKSAEKL